MAKPTVIRDNQLTGNAVTCPTYAHLCIGSLEFKDSERDTVVAQALLYFPDGYTGAALSYKVKPTKGTLLNAFRSVGAFMPGLSSGGRSFSLIFEPTTDQVCYQVELTDLRNNSTAAVLNQCASVPAAPRAAQRSITTSSNALNHHPHCTTAGVPCTLAANTVQRPTGASQTAEPRMRTLPRPTRPTVRAEAVRWGHASPSLAGSILGLVAVGFWRHRNRSDQPENHTDSLRRLRTWGLKNRQQTARTTDNEASPTRERFGPEESGLLVTTDGDRTGRLEFTAELCQRLAALTDL